MELPVLGWKRSKREQTRSLAWAELEPMVSRSPWQPERAGLRPKARHGSGTGVRARERGQGKRARESLEEATPKVCSQTRRKLAKSKPSITTFRPTPVSCGISERSLLCSIKSSLMRDFRVRRSLPVARPSADLSQPRAPPVGLSLATRSPGVGSQPCGAKYPRFCTDSKGV